MKCPHCHKDVALTRGGFIVWHQSNGALCLGAGVLP